MTPLLFLFPAAKRKFARNSSFSFSVSFVCRNIYHLFGAVNLSNTDLSTYPVDAYSLLCESIFTNLFCLKTSSSDWKRGPCNVSKHNIECPLHGEYENYSQFFAWKISTYVVKFIFHLDGKKHITEERVFTPYSQCHDISAIGPHDKMFKMSYSFWWGLPTLRNWFRIMEKIDK